MAYTRKCSVYLKCLYEHTKANNYCHKPREQLLMAWLSHLHFFVQLLGSFVPALPVFCSSPLSAPPEFQGRLNPLFPFPHYLLGSAALGMGMLGGRFITPLLLDPLWVILVGPFQLRLF